MHCGLPVILIILALVPTIEVYEEIYRGLQQGSPGITGVTQISLGQFESQQHRLTESF